MGFLSALASVGGAALGGAVDWGNQIGNSALGYYFGKKSTRDAGAVALRNQQAYDSWRLQNSPSLYRKGLEDAGLNPILAATNGIPSGATIGSNTSAYGGMTGSGKAESLGLMAGVASALALADKNEEEVKTQKEQTALLKRQQQLIEAQKQKTDAERFAVSANAASNRISADSSQWLVYDSKKLNSGGFRAFFNFKDVGGKAGYETVKTLRINKVTGDVFTLDGRKVTSFETLPAPTSAKKSTTNNNQYNYHFYDTKKDVQPIPVKGW